MAKRWLKWEAERERDFLSLTLSPRSIFSLFHSIFYAVSFFDLTLLFVGKWVYIRHRIVKHVKSKTKRTLARFCVAVSLFNFVWPERQTSPLTHTHTHTHTNTQTHTSPLTHTHIYSLVDVLSSSEKKQTWKISHHHLSMDNWAHGQTFESSLKLLQIKKVILLLHKKTRKKVWAALCLKTFLFGSTYMLIISTNKFILFFFDFTFWNVFLG